jgi:FkbM family methyltransferase
MNKLLLSLATWIARITPAPIQQALYRLGPLSRLIRAGLNRAAPHGYSRVQVAAGGLAGMTLVLDLQEEKDYWLGTYEPELQAAVAELVRAGTVAYDVGANIGYISLLLAKAVGEGGQVYAFEALPANVERLRANLSLNSMERRVQVVEAAVIDRSVPVQFLVGPSGGMGKAAGSAGRQRDYSQSISISGLALDDFVLAQGHPPPQVVKMDIEGGEVLALPGLRQVLRQHHPILLLELHGPEAAHVAWDELSAAGYRLCQMSSGYPPVPSCEAINWKAYLVAM